MTNLVTNLVGVVTVTAYCACAQCCGKWADGITASGAPVRQGTTAAANWLPFGTRIYVDGLGWRTVQDRMARRFSDRVDIYFDSHQAARRWGIRRLNIWAVQPRQSVASVKSVP